MKSKEPDRLDTAKELFIEAVNKEAGRLNKLGEHARLTKRFQIAFQALKEAMKSHEQREWERIERDIQSQFEDKRCKKEDSE